MRISQPCIALGIGLGLIVAGRAPAAAGQLALGRPAPPFVLQALDGRQLSNQSFRGRILVINVWGSWCPPCRMETPDLVAEAKAAGKAVAFLGVDTTELPPVVRAFAAAKGVTYPQVVTTGRSAFARDYDIRNYPTTFVIDARGVLRARHADNILPRRQLHAFIAAARQGRTASLDSDEQRKLDRLLDPAGYPLAGPGGRVVRSAYAAAAAIERAESEMDDAMDDPARDHDLIATHAREQTLRQAVIAALTPIARTPQDHELVDRLRGDAAVFHRDWVGAQAAYGRALTLAPRDGTALTAAAYVAVQRADNAAAARLDERLAALQPSYSADIAVARSQARLGARTASLAALDRAVSVAQAHGTPAGVAWTHLYGGRVAVQLGDLERARVEFRAAAAAAARIPHSDVRYQMYLEQAQEARVALGLSRAGQASLSLAPWTGPELPGSIASTFKFRLALTGRPAQSIDLTARGLPHGWIGSFCSDRVCSPFTTSVIVPPVGVKIVEIQVIPDGALRPRPVVTPVVTIEAALHGKVVSSASAAVTQ